MKRLLRKRRKQTKAPGTAPGSLIFVGEEGQRSASLRLIRYSAQEIRESSFETPSDAFPLPPWEGVSWLDFDASSDVGLIEAVGREFGLHRLLLEDILNTEQRAKIDDYGEYLFVVLKMPDFDEGRRDVRSQQISLVVFANRVITFRETPDDVFAPIVQRLHAAKGALRKSGPDYLAYTILDLVVDHYFVILERLGDRIEEVEAQLLEQGEVEALSAVYRLKKSAMKIRKRVWPMREVLNSLLRGDSDLVQPATRLYLRDVYDHTIQVVEGIESTRETLSSLLDLYLSLTGNRMNEVMKVLTIIATIFIPLTFLAGIYGMNFDYMPELSRPWAYPVLLGVMLFMGGGMAVIFKRKGWL